ncbi:MAG: hypothetical protein HYT63_00915, partial [Candidatus Yanofskybacteria bacterium]|nr:hypothetical protein [Candidatus Yanofskybacteria bacterium]
MSQFPLFEEEKETEFIPPNDSEETANGFDHIREITPLIGHSDTKTHQGEGLSWPSQLTDGDPFDEITWEKRTAKIVKSGGE